MKYYHYLLAWLFVLAMFVIIGGHADAPVAAIQREVFRGGTIEVFPDSPCGTFRDIANVVMQHDTNTLSRYQKGQLCKVPMHMIANPYQCPAYNWLHIANILSCDVANNAGMLTTEGVRLTL